MSEKIEIYGNGLNELHELLVRAAEMIWKANGRVDDPREEWGWTLESTKEAGVFQLNMCYSLHNKIEECIKQAAQELGLLPAPCEQGTGMTAKEALARLQGLADVLKQDTLPGTHGSAEVLEEHKAKLEVIKAAAQEFAALTQCLESKGLLEVYRDSSAEWGLYIYVSTTAARVAWRVNTNYELGKALTKRLSDNATLYDVLSELQRICDERIRVIEQKLKRWEEVC